MPQIRYGSGTRFRTLYELTTLLMRASHADDVVRIFLDDALPNMGASAGAFHVLAGDELVMRGHVGWPAAQANEYMRLPMSADLPATMVATTGNGFFIGSRDEMAAQYPQMLAVQEQVEDHAWVIVPVVGPYGMRGIIGFSFTEPQVFGEADKEALQHLGFQLGHALDRAEQLEQAHQDALALQHGFLPRALPHVPGYRFAASYRPADAPVGGDWYAGFVVPEHGLFLAVGDVAGRGVRAAEAMNQLRFAMWAYCWEGHSPGRVLSLVGRLATTHRDLFATALIVQLDPASGGLRYAVAGHPPCVVVEHGQPRLLTDVLGPPLGISDSFEYADASDRLAPGSTIALYSDGVIERRFERLDAGIRRLERALIDSGNDVAHVLDLCLSGLEAAHDDACLLIVKRDQEEPAPRGLR
jgi:serine phosphatase RsbU (regulator of sigma subunit)